MPDCDPITVLLDQLAAQAEHLARLDTREAEHHAALVGQLTELAGQAAGISRTLQDYAAALTRLTATSAPDPDPGGYRPAPPPPWWNLAADHRREPVTRLRAWVEQVYRPGYGHLAASLGPCWASHDLCLYALDIAAELWSALYLRPGRSARLVSAQAEYQARILPALAEQLRIETGRCDHPRSPAPASGQPWGTP